MDKPRRKNYHYTGICLEPGLKRRVRILAAMNGVSMAVLAGELIELGLPVFKGQAKGKLEEVKE